MTHACFNSQRHNPHGLPRSTAPSRRRTGRPPALRAPRPGPGRPSGGTKRPARVAAVRGDGSRAALQGNRPEAPPGRSGAHKDDHPNRPARGERGWLSAPLPPDHLRLHPPPARPSGRARNRHSPRGGAPRSPGRALPRPVRRRPEAGRDLTQLATEQSPSTLPIATASTGRARTKWRRLRSRLRRLFTT